MYCPNCGAQNTDFAGNCSSCNYSFAGVQQPYMEIPNYLVQAILVTIFCCMPFGIVSIVYAAQVNGKIQAHDYAGAQAASRSAKTWCWASFGSGIAIGLLYAIIVLSGLISGYSY